MQSERSKMNLQSMPVKILERILTYLPFADISQLRGLSKRIHFAARERLNAAFLDLGPRLATRYTAHLIYNKNRGTNNASEDVMFRGRLLKLLASEHSILLAFCRHYIVNGVGCFSAGKILDLFYELETNREIPLESQDEENKKVAKLILSIDQYFDWFERYRMLSEKHCSWFGVCVVDLLDSYLEAKHHLVVSQNSSSVKVTGQYMVNYYAEAPPKISDQLGCNISQYELFQVLRYLRRHARWHNFVTAFQDVCDKRSDLDEEQEKIYAKCTPNGYDKIYKKKSYNIADNDSRVISLRAVIRLECDGSIGPARLNSYRHFNKSVSDGQTTTGRLNSSMDHSITDDTAQLNKLVDNSCKPLRLIKDQATRSTNKRCKDDMYSFRLELRSVHRNKWTDSKNGLGEKFGETTLYINHTLDSIFAAQSECRLY